MTQIGVIVNEGKVLGHGLEELRAALADAGFADPPWHEVPKSKHVPKRLRKLVEGGVDRVLVWGGDGTVRRAIDTIVSDKLDHVSIGILPAGTANLLAKNLGVPIDVRGAVDIALHGTPRPIDVARMNDEHFAVMGGAGFDAMLIKDAEENDLKDRFGRLGYVWASMRNTHVSPARASVEVNGRPWFDGRASCVLVANVGTILGGIDAFPDASPTDGLLDVGVVQTRTNFEWLRLAVRAVLGRADFSPLVQVAQAETVRIKLDRTLPWEIDGGARDRADRFKIRVVPDAVLICQPDTP